MKKAKLKKKLRAARARIHNLEIDLVGLRYGAERLEGVRLDDATPPNVNTEPAASTGEVAWIEEVIAKEIFDTTSEKVTGPGAQASVKRAALLIAKAPDRLSEVPLHTIVVEVALRAAESGHVRLVLAARGLASTLGVDLAELCPLCGDPDLGISKERHEIAFHNAPLPPQKPAA